MTDEIILSVTKLRKWFPVKSSKIFGEKQSVKAVNDITFDSPTGARRWASSASRAAARRRWGAP